MHKGGKEGKPKKDKNRYIRSSNINLPRVIYPFSVYHIGTFFVSSPPRSCNQHRLTLRIRDLSRLLLQRNFAETSRGTRIRNVAHNKGLRSLCVRSAGQRMGSCPSDR